MQELTAQNAADVLHAAGHLADPRNVRVRELSGGVSNVVLLVEQGDERFVVKQARGKLRVQADWRCSIERIWREVEVLEAYSALLKTTAISYSASVPKILWSDRDLYAYAMTAASERSVTWKEQLLRGDLNYDARIPGALLGELHARSWGDDSLGERFADRTYFIDLRLNPYYRHAASNYLPLADPLLKLAEQTLSQRQALVHGDFSPKNFLIAPDGAMLIDFEVGHFGDPAFDVGFCLCHLVLKAIHLPAHATQLLEMVKVFWQAYNYPVASQLLVTRGSLEDLVTLELRISQNLAGCLVARVYGKSPVEYLTPPEQLRAVRLSELLFDLGMDADQESTCETLRSEILIG